MIALDHVSFQVKKGEFVAIVGASGSGKSTLMNLIGGIDRPTSGSVVIDGKKIFDMNEREMAIFRRRNIGIVYQFYNPVSYTHLDVYKRQRYRRQMPELIKSWMQELFQKAAEKVFLQKQWRQAEVSVKAMEYRWELRLQHPQMRT